MIKEKKEQELFVSREGELPKARETALKKKQFVKFASFDDEKKR